MFKLLRAFFGMVTMILMVYFATTVSLGGQTTAEHMMDIWRSEVVQAKWKAVKTGSTAMVLERIAELRIKANVNDQGSELLDGERDMLEGVIAENLNQQ